MIEFLTDLHHLEHARRMLLLWDGVPAHRSRCWTDWINDERSWLSVKHLPAYAPEINPTEQLFGNLKSTELANLCSDTIAEVQGLAEDSLGPHGKSRSTLLRLSASLRFGPMTKQRRQLHDAL